MKKYMMLLISMLLLVACTKSVDVVSEEHKLMSTTVNHQTIDVSKLFDDECSFEYYIYFIDGNDILFRRYSIEGTHIDELYVYNMESNDLTNIFVYDANDSLTPVYLDNGTLYFVRETNLNDSNKIEFIMYKDGVFSDIVQEEDYLLKTLYFGMYDDSLSLILFRANEDLHPSLLMINVKDKTQEIIEYPKDDVIGEKIYEDQILFITSDGFYRFKDNKMSDFILTKDEIMINNEFFTVKGKMDPLYLDESVLIESNNSKIELKNSYIIHYLSSGVLITEDINKEMFTKVLYRNETDMIKDASGKNYAMTYFNGNEIITEPLYDEEFFKHTTFLSAVNNKLYFFEGSGLLHEITIDLK